MYPLLLLLVPVSLFATVHHVPAEHATLWAGLAGTLARAQGTVQNDPRSLEPAWVGQRLSVCGGWGQVRDPTGDTTDLLASTDRPDCAGWWPRRAGWHALLPELDSTQAERWRYVRAAEDAPALWRASIQRQMAAQVATAPTATDPETAYPDSRWRWWLSLWLLLGGLWLLERAPPRRSE